VWKNAEKARICTVWVAKKVLCRGVVRNQNKALEIGAGSRHDFQVFDER
jgi:hypothetical protein